MNNYKEVSFLISSLFVIYFFKDIITTLIILVILSSISFLLIKSDFEKTTDIDPYNNYDKQMESNLNYEKNVQKEQYDSQQNPNNLKKSSNFIYNR